MARWRDQGGPVTIPAWLDDFDAAEWRAGDVGMAPQFADYRARCRHAAAVNAWLGGHPAAAREYAARFIAGLQAATAELCGG
jgi:hypothetical protein